MSRDYAFFEAAGGRSRLGAAGGFETVGGTGADGRLAK
jgi:hypothetical protein